MCQQPTSRIHNVNIGHNDNDGRRIESVRFVGRTTTRVVGIEKSDVQQLLLARLVVGKKRFGRLNV